MTRQQRWQLKMKLTGKCVTCGKPATQDTFLCEEHRQKANRRGARNRLDARTQCANTAA